MYLAEMVTLRVVPVVAIALLNALIVSRVTRITRIRKLRRRHIPLRAVNADPTSRRLSPAVITVDHNNESVASVSCHRRVRRVSLDERNLQLTIILILVSTTYILFYLPILVHFVLFKMKRSGIVDVGFTFLDVYGNYAKALHVAGFAINFLLYTVSGRVFREQLVSLICRNSCRPSMLDYACPMAGGTATTNAPGKLSAI